MVLVPESVIDVKLKSEAVPLSPRTCFNINIKIISISWISVTVFPSIFAIAVFKPRAVFEVVFCELLGKAYLTCRNRSFSHYT